MSKPPTNIRYFMKRYEQKMTGANQTSMVAIRRSIEDFNKERSETLQLRNINLAAYQDEKAIENELLYIVRVKGRKNTVYQNRVLKFYMFVFDSFPKEPPEIIAGHCYDTLGKVQKRFLHLNVSQSGQFCMRTNQKNEEYYEYTTLKDILMELENSVYYPNVTSSYNNELYLAYSSKGDNSSYYKLLNAQARLLDEDEDESGSDSDEEAVENT